jgi:hypothetical protein
MNVPLSSLRIVRVVARVGSGVGELGGVTGEAAAGGTLANGESHAAVMTSRTSRAVKRGITPTPFVTVEFAKPPHSVDENLAMLYLARGAGQRSTDCEVCGDWCASAWGRTPVAVTAVSAEAKKVRARKMIRELRSLGYRVEVLPAASSSRA